MIRTFKDFKEFKENTGKFSGTLIGGTQVN